LPEPELLLKFCENFSFFKPEEPAPDGLLDFLQFEVHHEQLPITLYFLLVGVRVLFIIVIIFAGDICQMGIIGISYIVVVGCAFLRLGDLVYVSQREHLVALPGVKFKV